MVGNLLLFVYNGTVWRVYAVFYTKWIASVRRCLFGHISGFSLRQIEKRPAGEWITRQNADVHTAVSLLGHPLQLPHTAYLLINILISSVILFVMSPGMYGLVILFAMMQQVFSSCFVARPMTRLSENALEATAENSSRMHALITCADTALLYDAKGFLLEHFEQSSHALRSVNMKMHRRTALGSGLLPVWGMGGYLVMLLIGGAWIARGETTFGDLSAMLQYRNGVLMGVTILMGCMVNIKISLAGVGRVLETLRISQEE